MHVMQEKICPWCGEPFEPARPWSRFCSKACRVAFHESERRAAFEALQRERNAEAARLVPLTRQ